MPSESCSALSRSGWLKEPGLLSREAQRERSGTPYLLHMVSLATWFTPYIRRDAAGEKHRGESTAADHTLEDVVFFGHAASPDEGSFHHPCAACHMRGRHFVAYYEPLTSGAGRGRRGAGWPAPELGAHRGKESAEERAKICGPSLKNCLDSGIHLCNLIRHSAYK